MGFEAVDATPDLYQGGSVTVGVVPSDHETGVWTYKNIASSSSSSTRGTVGETVYNSLASTAMFPLPPQLVTTLKQFPNSSTWAAKEGVYVPCRISGTDVPIRTLVPLVTMGVSYSPGAHYDVDGTNNCIVSLGAFTAGGAQSGCLLSDFDVSSAFFSGLNQNASIVITAKFIIEQFIAGDQAIAAMAQMSPPYDPIVIDHYFRVIGALPPGVPSGHNKSGKWWKDVGKTLMYAYKNYAKPALEKAPLPPQARVAFEVVDSSLEQAEALAKKVAKARKERKKTEPKDVKDKKK
jgi:hypothetical protein